MSLSESNQSSSSEVARTRSLYYARIVGHAMTALLLALGLVALIQGQGVFDFFKGAYFVVYAIVLSLPYGRLSDAAWKRCYIVLAGLSALFVFVMVAVVMFAYMAAADRGEKLGVPGFEGTLIFLALLQVPVVLFQRKPDLLD